MTSRRLSRLLVPGAAVLLAGVFADSAALAHEHDSPWFAGGGGIHLGTQIGTADHAGNLISAYLGGDWALLQHGVDLGVVTVAVIGASISTRGEILFTFTPVAVGTDHFQAGIDLLWSPGRGQDESPFGISVRFPLSFR